PNAAILVVGPPDGNRLPRGCRDDGVPDRTFPCAPLNAAETANYAERFGAADPPPQSCRWHPPPNLQTVRDVQRQAAAANGWFFWDWSRVMGGSCGIHRWAEASPPLAYPDHVHLQTAGYAASADALFQELMAYYATWRTAHRSLVAELP